jgi:TPR repeat protein
MRRRVSHLVLAVFLLLPALSSAQSPNAPRLFELGMDALLGVGPDRDEQSAIDYIRRSADLGYPPAEVVLGYFYETGTIVPSEAGQAAVWYKKAAQQDDPVGEWLLGRLIFTGGIQRDLNEAARWLQKAAGHNDPFGEYLLGRVKLERQDYAAAADSFRKAAMQGLPQAQQQLGLMLKQGQGGNINKSEAYMWLLMSFNAGNQAVATDLRELVADLSTAQVSQAKSKARELEPITNRVVVARGCAGWAGEYNDIPVPPPPDIQRFCR